ncbi:MAG: CPBP family intramembrane metalloprotease [Anaerolineaceae bacterium]|nr:CPBP family intramembrane metalloprotease [Anaerolineaceae bacterium]
MLVWSVIGLIVVPVLTIGVPVYWTTVVEKLPISSLGITTRYWLPSLGLGAVASLAEIVPLLINGTLIGSSAQWLPMAIAGAASLFEPLFVFGWLQQRFEKDFGVLPAILMAAAGFGLYHINTLPEAMSGLFTSAVVYAVFFRLTSNLLVTWPLLWSVSAARICIASGVCFADWSLATTYGILLAVEAAFIVVMAFRQRRIAARLSQ